MKVQQTEIEKTLSKNNPVDLETLRNFKKKDEIRLPQNISDKKEPIWCEARKENYFFVSPMMNVFPCSYIARDVLENKLFPYHPIDYPYNWRYGNLKAFKLEEVLYNNDFSNISGHLQGDPLSICKVKCGKCV